MNGSTQQEDLTRMSRQGFDLMFQGIDIYNRMMRYWMDSAELFTRGKGEDTARNVVDTCSSAIRDSMSRLMGPMRSFANPVDFFQLWQDYTSMQFTALPGQIGTDKLNWFLKSQQEQFHNLANSYIDYVRKMGELSRKSMEGKGDGQAMKESLDTSEALLNSWLSFISEEARNSFRLLKSSVEEQIQREQEAQQQQH